MTAASNCAFVPHPFAFLDPFGPVFGPNISKKHVLECNSNEEELKCGPKQLDSQNQSGQIQTIAHCLWNPDLHPNSCNHLHANFCALLWGWVLIPQLDEDGNKSNKRWTRMSRKIDKPWKKKFIHFCLWMKVTTKKVAIKKLWPWKKTKAYGH